MTANDVAVVGASGRVGQTLAQHLSLRWSVQTLSRQPGELPEALAARLGTDVRVVVNAAGVAHVVAESETECARLLDGNVVLPVALGRAALERGASFLHVSSTKANAPTSSAYARSKRDGETALRMELGTAFEESGLGLVILRPPALLLPPFEAGRLVRLRWARLVPRWAVPPLPLPVVTPERLRLRVDQLVAALMPPVETPGLRVVEFERGERGSLRDVGTAFRELAMEVPD